MTWSLRIRKLANVVHLDGVEAFGVIDDLLCVAIPPRPEDLFDRDSARAGVLHSAAVDARTIATEITLNFDSDPRTVNPPRRS
jgi:hypothetical protein